MTNDAQPSPSGMKSAHRQGRLAPQAEDYNVGVEEKAHQRRSVSVEALDRSGRATRWGGKGVVIGKRAKQRQPARRVAVGCSTGLHFCEPDGAVRLRSDTLFHPIGHGLMLAPCGLLDMPSDVIFKMYRKRCHVRSIADLKPRRNPRKAA